MKRKSDMFHFIEKLKFRKYILLLIDFASSAVIATLYYLLIGSGNIRYAGLLSLLGTVYLVRILFGVYRQVVRYATAGSYLRLIFSDATGALCYTAVSHFFLPDSFHLNLWQTIAIIASGCLFSLIERFAYQYLYRKAGLTVSLKGGDSPLQKKEKIAILGAGSIGFYLAGELTTNKESPYLPCCFVDNDKEKIGQTLNGIRVYSEENAPEILRKLGIACVVVAIPYLSHARRRELYDNYTHEGFKVMIYELPLVESKDGFATEYDVSKKPIVRDFKIEDLLFRDPIRINNAKTSAYYRDKTILITGGGGSIGSEICRQLAGYQPKKLIILDIYENNAYDIQQELRLKYGKSLDLEVEIASVREEGRVEEVMRTYRPDIVVHAAAHKHVPLMEHNCAEAIKNNVFGTLHVASAAEKYGVKKFIMISTDKAVNPTNVMGASKRMCEMIVQSREESHTEFTAVRFGNVLGSNGSVIPLFKRQIASGGPVTITDFRIIRYFMTIPEAAQLVLEAGSMAKNGELYVLDMGKPVKILKLAEDMIRLSGFEPYKDIAIQEIGLREGEKLYEELLVKTEELDKTENNMIFVERDRGLSRKEVTAKLEILEKAVTDGTPDAVKTAMKQVVPTYHDPAEVNRKAAQAAEMQIV